MKRSILIFVALAMSFGVVAQEVGRTKEVGITFVGMDNFGITYRTGSDNALWRFNSLFARGRDLQSESSAEERESTHTGFGASFGREYRQPVNEKLVFRIGADLSFDYLQTKDNYIYPTDSTSNTFIRERTTFSPGIMMVIGLNYRIDDHFLIGAEMLPFVKYITGKETGLNNRLSDGTTVESDLSGYDFGISSNSIRLSLVYTWR